MNKPEFHIRSYDDLLAEKERLKSHFRTQKDNLKLEIEGIKDTLNPVSGIMKTVGKSIGKFMGPDKSMGVLNSGLNFAVDFIIRKLLLKKSNWLVKLAVPFFIRNILSNLAASKIKSNMPEMKPVIDELTKTAKQV